MLDKPFAGWTNISFANVTISGSYLTDIPLDFVEAINNVIELNKIQTVVIDAESKGEYIFVFDKYRSYIIEESDYNGKTQIYVEEKNINKIALELANDIERYLESWKRWNPDLDESEIDDKEHKCFVLKMKKREKIFKNFIKKYKKIKT
jgi:hypothetical protein